MVESTRKPPFCFIYVVAGMGTTWAYQSCFGGPNPANGVNELNAEPMNVANLFNNYQLKPSITKVTVVYLRHMMIMDHVQINII